MANNRWPVTEEVLGRAQRGLMQAATLHVAAGIQAGVMVTATNAEHEADVIAAYSEILTGLVRHQAAAKNELDAAAKRAERARERAARKAQREEVNA